MTGGRDPVGGGIWETNEGGGTNIPGEAERTGTVRGMREVDVGGIVGVPQDDTAWACYIGAMDLGRLGHRRQTADVLAGLTDQGRAAELPSRGLPRTVRD